MRHRSQTKGEEHLSGGKFNYSQYQIAEIADQIEYLIVNNEPKDSDGWFKGPRYTPETIKEFENGLQVLRQAFIYAHRIDLLVSYDDREETFHQQLKSELENVKLKEKNT
jgi:hypothetical protein